MVMSRDGWSIIKAETRSIKHHNAITLTQHNTNIRRAQLWPSASSANTYNFPKTKRRNSPLASSLHLFRSAVSECVQCDRVRSGLPLADRQAT